MDHETTRLSDAVAFLARQFNHRPHPDQIHGYVKALSGYDPSGVMRALRRCAEECRYFPALKDILDRLEDEGPHGKARTVNVEASERRAMQAEIARLHASRKPYALLAGPLPDTLAGFPWTARAAAAYRTVCHRLPEWVDSRTAQGPLPPCVACQTDQEIKNCDEPTVEDCHRWLTRLATERNQADRAATPARKHTADLKHDAQDPRADGPP